MLVAEAVQIVIGIVFPLCACETLFNVVCESVDVNKLKQLVFMKIRYEIHPARL